jgi:hypothetical protein
MILLSIAAILQMAQASAPVPGGRPIPDAGFKSWSLFLVCNPEWLTRSKKADLDSLHEQFRSFGETTGEYHAAVWFFRTDPTKASDLDTARMSEYCQRFGLVPSQGPHVIVTTVHPDRWRSARGDEPGDGLIIVGFSRKSAKQIQAALNKLNYQIAANKLSQEEVDSQQYWLSWVDAFTKTCRWLDKVKITVNAKAVKVERTGICST